METGIFDIPTEMKPAEERKRLRADLLDAKNAVAEWQEVINECEKRLAELRGKR